MDTILVMAIAQTIEKWIIKIMDTNTTEILIPEDILKDYVKPRKPRKGSTVCRCGHLNMDIYWYPYSYDIVEHAIYFASTCEKCGELMFTKS